MRKIPSLFQRDFANNPDRVTREVHPDAEWVIAGEGVATRKWDGSCVMFDDDGNLWKRYDAKRGKTPPADFVPAQQPDPVTGHWTGWVPVTQTAENWMHLAALVNCGRQEEGTYELCGPAMNGNPDGVDSYRFIKHGMDWYSDCPRDFDGLAAYLEPLSIEGIVWHHPDGHMVKIKRSDFHGKSNKVR